MKQFSSLEIISSNASFLASCVVLDLLRMMWPTSPWPHHHLSWRWWCHRFSGSPKNDDVIAHVKQKNQSCSTRGFQSASLIQYKPTVWELVNLSNDVHVIHLHQSSIFYYGSSRSWLELSYLPKSAWNVSTARQKSRTDSRHLRMWSQRYPYLVSWYYCHSNYGDIWHSWRICVALCTCSTFQSSPVWIQSSRKELTCAFLCVLVCRL